MSYFDQIAPQIAAGAFNPQTYNPWGGMTMLPKAQSNFGAAAPAIATNHLPIDMMNAVTNAGSAASEAQYRNALAQSAQTQNQIALANLGFMRDLMSGANDDYTPQPQGSFGGTSGAPGAYNVPPSGYGVNAAPTGAGVGSPAPSASSSSNGFGPYAAPVVKQLRSEGWTDAAITGALANGQAEGGFDQPWQKAGGNENSFGHWQFNAKGELPGYLDFVKSAGGGDPQDSTMQARYLASRMQELHPGFGQITDPKQATNIIEAQFERPAKQTSRMGQMMSAQSYLAKNQVAPGPQYAQADTGTATDATPEASAPGEGPPSPGTGAPGAPVGHAMGTPTAAALQLMKNGPPMPNAATTAPTFAPGVAPGGGTTSAGPAPAAASPGGLPSPLVAAGPQPAPPQGPAAAGPVPTPNAPASAAAPPQGAPRPLPAAMAPPAVPAPGGVQPAPYMPYTQQQIAKAKANAMMFTVMGKPIPPQIQQVLSFAPGGTNDPQAIAARAAATAQANQQAQAQYAGQIAAAQKRAALPFTPVRPGGGFNVPDANGNPSPNFTTAPTIQTRIVNGVPTQVYSQVTPNGVVETPVPGQSAYTPQQEAAGAQQGKAGVELTTEGPIAQARAQGEAQGRAGVEYGSLLNPNLTAPPMTGQPMPSPAAPASASQPVPQAPVIRTPATGAIPPLSQQGVVTNTPAELDKAIPAWQEKQNEWNAQLAPARQAEQRLGVIADAFKQVQTGAWTTEKAAFGATLKALGIDPSIAMSTDPGQVERALHENYKQTLISLKASNARFTQREFAVLSENSEHPDLQPEANLQMLSDDIATMRQAQQLPAAWIQAQQHGWKNPLSFESAWNAANPLPEAVEQVKQEIGPLKGMAPTSANIPAGAHQIGTYKGNPVYQMPDGSRKVLQ